MCCVIHHAVQPQVQRSQIAEKFTETFPVNKHAIVNNRQVPAETWNMLYPMCGRSTTLPVQLCTDPVHVSCTIKIYVPLHKLLNPNA